jgi:hypothetical protein
MPGLAAAAAAIGAAVVSSPHPEPPVGVLDYGGLRYEIRAVFDGAGLGGLPAYCAAKGEDYVLVAYRVINNTDRMEAAAAIPRVELVDPTGQTHRGDPVLGRATEGKALPFLSFRHGEVEAHGWVMLADVFVTPRGAVRQSPWRIRAAALGTDARALPAPKAVGAEDCPRLEGPARSKEDEEQ